MSQNRDKDLFEELGKKYTSEDLHKSSLILAEALQDSMPQAKLHLEVNNFQILLTDTATKSFVNDNDSERLLNVIKQFSVILNDFKKEVLENKKEEK